jgi:hypothetical protein
MMPTVELDRPRWRRPIGLWLAGSVALVGATGLFTLTDGQATWYVWLLGVVGIALMTWVAVWPIAVLIGRYRAGYYKHKSTPGERVVLTAIFALLVATVVVQYAGPLWVTLVLLAITFASLLLLNRRQKARIQRASPNG